MTREDVLCNAVIMGMDLDYNPEILIDDITELTDYQWREIRHDYGIGGSDAGAIVGVNKYKNAYQLAIEKTTPVAVDDTKDAEKQFTLDFGHAMEQPILDWYAGVSGYEVFTDRHMYRHPKYPFMLCNGDGFAKTDEGEIIGLEIKTYNYAMKNLWKSGVFGVDAVVKNPEYAYQIAHYMAVMNLNRYDLIACCGNSASDNLIITFYRDLSIEKMLIEKEQEFWNDLQSGILPAYQSINEYQYDNIVSALNEKNQPVDETTEISHEFLPVMSEIENLQMQKDELKLQDNAISERLKALQIQIIEAMGDCSSGQLYIDENHYYQVSNKSSLRETLDTAKFKVCMPEVYAQFKKGTLTKPTFKFKKMVLKSKK